MAKFGRPLLPFSRIRRETFELEEQQEYLRLDALERSAEGEMQAINMMLGVGPDGWVPCDQYDAAKAAVDQMKQECLARAETEMDKIAVRDHWIFGDIDEDKYQ